MDVWINLRVLLLTNFRSSEVNDHAYKLSLTLKFIVLELIIFKKQTLDLIS